MIRLRARVDERGLDVDLTLAEGQTTAITGPNGSGKSTVLAVLAGLLVPDAGELRIGDDVLHDDGRGAGDAGSADRGASDAESSGRGLRARRVWVPPHRRGIVLMSQRVLLFPHLSARDNVAFGPRSHGIARRDARETADRWLAEVGADGLADRRATTLSGGQAQRVALARALAADPRILLLDEPFTAVDADSISPLRELLARVLVGRTAVIVSHDPDDAAHLATRTLAMRAGRMVADSGA
ncbi:MAG: ABC transporter [Microbacterium sp.]|nr:MAG: ABC transporter [Microbacterium sp.]